MSEKMVQCKFRKGNTIQVAWIEKKLGVKLGAIVELKSALEGDEHGWEIIETGTEMDAEYVRDRSRDFTRTRQASDI